MYGLRRIAYNKFYEGGVKLLLSLFSSMTADSPVLFANSGGDGRAATLEAEAVRVPRPLGAFRLSVLSSL